MKHDLDKLRRRLTAEAHGIAEELKLLPDDADGPAIDRAKLLLRDLIANARAARNEIERAKAKTTKEATR